VSVKIRLISCNLKDHYNQVIYYRGINLQLGVKYMLAKKIFILMILSVTVALTACGNSANNAALTGVIAHTHRMTLPAGFVTTIRIEDTTNADKPGKKVAEEIIKNQGEVLPIPFAIVYDPGKINPDHTYTMRVEIDDDTGNLLYTNVTAVPVITHGNPTRNVKIIVVLPNE
jgi:putative lipoprotein